MSEESQDIQMGEQQQEQVEMTYVDPEEIPVEKLSEVYNTLLGQFNKISTLLANDSMRQQYIQANIPDIQALGQRIAELSNINIPVSEEYNQVLRQGIKQLQDFLLSFIRTKPNYAPYLVDSAFWMYFPLTLQELEVVTGDIETIFPDDQRLQIKEYLQNRLNATNDYLQRLMQVYFSLALSV
jgi:hypothetical protein